MLRETCAKLLFPARTNQRSVDSRPEGVVLATKERLVTCPRNYSCDSLAIKTSLRHNYQAYMVMSEGFIASEEL